MTHKGTTLCVLALLSCVLRAGVAQGSRHTDVPPPGHLEKRRVPCGDRNWERPWGCR